MSANELRVISADSHVLEPHDLWTSRLAGGPFADRAPKMVEDEHHGHVFVIEGLRPFPVGLAGAAGKSSKELRWTGDQVESLRSGGWDPVARLADMDMDGIAAEVLYPSVGMTLAQSTDVEYQLACIRAYNDWLVEYCDGGQGRLVGLAMIPTVDVDAGVAEVDRTADDGLRGRWCRGCPPRVTTRRRASTRCGPRSPSGRCPCRSTSSPARWAATPRCDRGSS